MPAIENLRLVNIGPAPSMELDFGARFNLITGDNGLGKSFILDAAWWALTRSWPRQVNAKVNSGYPAQPREPRKAATISAQLSGVKKQTTVEGRYDAKRQEWRLPRGRPTNAGLVLYALADGSFAVWDPARNYWRDDNDARRPAFTLSTHEVWHGLRDGERILCQGLVADLAAWTLQRGDKLGVLNQALAKMSADGERMELGELTRISIEDVRDVPSIVTAANPRGVPVVFASSGVRRILALTYMLTWAWHEHRLAAEQLGETPTRTVTVLFDEIESHLHPRWQRTILNSLNAVVQSLHQDAAVQVIAATHSPLVLASAEPLFDPAKDAWFDIDLQAGEVVLRKREFVALGDVSNWLVSEAFDLTHARAKEAEVAISEAMALLSEQAPLRQRIHTVHQKLVDAKLPAFDPFWVRWQSKFSDQISSAAVPPSRKR